MDEALEKIGMKYEFGRFVLDPHERLLYSNGEPAHLTEKVFDTLLLLVRHNGQLLTKDQMLTSIWEESFVEEGNLAKTISRLRKILNTDGEEFIETLPRRGYRFRAQIRHVEGETNLLVHRHLRLKVSRGTDAHEPATAATLHEIHSIAVLPFQPLGGNAGDNVLGLGISDALITQLTRAGDIQVRPTSSIIRFNIARQDAIVAGRELDVDAVLEGNYQRAGDRLRLTVQMVRSADGSPIWAESFTAEVEHIFDVQDRIADRVVEALQKKLSDEARAKLTKRYTESVEAYEEYLKGRFYYNKRTIEGYDVALACFEKAIEIDPSYALAYAGLADIYNLLPLYDGFAPRDYFAKAKAAALKALVLDSELAEAHAALGLAILHYDWNWSGAEVAFQNAVKLDSNCASGYLLLGVYFLRVERIGESLIALKKARELDPFSPTHAVWLAEVLRVIGETDASIQLHLETIESFPEFFPAHYHLAFSYIDAGRLAEAASQCEEAVALSHENSLTLSLEGILHAAMGESSAVRMTLDKLLRMKNEKYISSANIATVYAAMEDDAKTLEWLERGLEERDPNMTWIKSDREFAFLHHNDRFRRILQKVGLTDDVPHVIEEAVPALLSRSMIVASAIVIVLLIALAGIYFFEGR